MLVNIMMLAVAMVFIKWNMYSYKKGNGDLFYPFMMGVWTVIGFNSIIDIIKEIF